MDVSISYQKQLIDIKEKYRRAGQEWPATNRMIAEWAVRKKLYETPEHETVSSCARDLSNAFGSDTRVNSASASVRTMAAAPRLVIDDDQKTRQLWFWDDVDTVSHEHMVASFQARRNQGRADIRKLQDDIEDYNQNRLKKGYNVINMSFNFDELNADELTSEEVA